MRDGLSRRTSIRVATSGAVATTALFYEACGAVPPLAPQQTGTTPPGVDNPEFYRVRSGSVMLGKNVDWLEATGDLRRAFVDHPDPDRSLLAGGLSG